jgi:hypothetical protein
MSRFVAVDRHPAPSSCVTLVQTFLISQSIRKHSIAAERCSCIVLKVRDVLLPPIHLSNRKNRITEHCSSLEQTESGVAMINSKALTMELT